MDRIRLLVALVLLIGAMVSLWLWGGGHGAGARPLDGDAFDQRSSSVRIAEAQSHSSDSASQGGAASRERLATFVEVTCLDESFDAVAEVTLEARAWEGGVVPVSSVRPGVFHVEVPQSGFVVLRATREGLAEEWHLIDLSDAVSGLEIVMQRAGVINIRVGPEPKLRRSISCLLLPGGADGLGDGRERISAYETLLAAEALRQLMGRGSPLGREWRPGSHEVKGALELLRGGGGRSDFRADGSQVQYEKVRPGQWHYLLTENLDEAQSPDAFVLYASYDPPLQGSAASSLVSAGFEVSSGGSHFFSPTLVPTASVELEVPSWLPDGESLFSPTRLLFARDEEGGVRFVSSTTPFYAPVEPGRSFLYHGLSPGESRLMIRTRESSERYSVVAEHTRLEPYELHRARPDSMLGEGSLSLELVGDGAEHLVGEVRSQAASVRVRVYYPATGLSEGGGVDASFSTSIALDSVLTIVNGVPSGEYAVTLRVEGGGHDGLRLERSCSVDGGVAPVAFEVPSVASGEPLQFRRNDLPPQELLGEMRVAPLFESESPAQIGVLHAVSASESDSFAWELRGELSGWPDSPVQVVLTTATRGTFDPVYGRGTLRYDASGKPTELTFDVLPATNVSIIVSDERGQELGRHTVSYAWQLPDGLHVGGRIRARTSTDGRLRVSGAIPGASLLIEGVDSPVVIPSPGAPGSPPDTIEVTMSD